MAVKAQIGGSLLPVSGIKAQVGGSLLTVSNGYAQVGGSLLQFYGAPMLETTITMGSSGGGFKQGYENAYLGGEGYGSIVDDSLPGDDINPYYLLFFYKDTTAGANTYLYVTNRTPTYANFDDPGEGFITSIKVGSFDTLTRGGADYAGSGLNVGLYRSWRWTVLPAWVDATPYSLVVT